MTVSTHLASSPASTTLSAPVAARTPTPHPATSRAFVSWSDHCGTATIGAPHATASSVEFHPQCVTKHPTAPCDSTRTWSHHSTTMPPPSPSPSPSSLSSLRTTHRYGRAVAARPRRSSSFCRLLTTDMLPNDTYTTDPAGFASSHSM
ncbi:Os02g0203200 [Oryza sativa Japonica Group]|uniref:Os02g0203200 protein n=1 Tax=Oryza sativa subsp. japonica TaxID=39947 RepID=Q0E2Y6_ORYSJ|nr:Os02g0203200 [Oryza sativa Japonica Group]|eukprot:NP_001046238.1 Os02g0203200 [Oryza sativa Japonica Group]